MDVCGLRRGPFDSSEMRLWLRRGCFEALGGELAVRRTRGPLEAADACACVSRAAFRPLREIARDCGRCPRALCGARDLWRASEGEERPRLPELARYASDASSDDEDSGEESPEEEEDVGAFFTIVGMVDGIADELDASDADPDNWTTNAVCKQRVLS